jgi:hypothetical protein
MNLLREEYCKEIDVPMGLDNIYDYCIWLEKKHKKDVINAWNDGRNLSSGCGDAETYYIEKFSNETES